MADYSSKVIRFEQGDNSFELIPEILEFSAFTDFPLSGTAGVLYIDKSTNRSYRWNDINLEYVKIAEPNEAPRVVEANSVSAFPVTGSSAILYIDKSSNRIYRWDSTNSTYKNITTDLTDFLEKADTAIIVDGNTASIDVGDGDYVIVKNSTISGITDGLYRTNDAVLAGVSFTSSNLSTVPITNGIFNHLRTNTRAMIDRNTLSRMKFVVIPSSAEDPISYLNEALDLDQSIAIVRGTTNLASLIGLTSGTMIGIFTRVFDSSRTDSRYDFIAVKKGGVISTGSVNNINNSDAVSFTYNLINKCPANADTLFKTITYTYKYNGNAANSTVSLKFADFTASESVPSGYVPMAVCYYTTGWNNAMLYGFNARRFYSGNTNTAVAVKFLADVTSEHTFTCEIMYVRSGFVAS